MDSNLSGGVKNKINYFEKCIISPIHHLHTLKIPWHFSLVGTVSESSKRGSGNQVHLLGFYLMFWDISYKTSFLSNSIWPQNRSLDDQNLFHQLYYKVLIIPSFKKKTFPAFLPSPCFHFKGVWIRMNTWRITNYLLFLNPSISLVKMRQYILLMKTWL